MIENGGGMMEEGAKQKRRFGNTKRSKSFCPTWTLFEGGPLGVKTQNHVEHGMLFDSHKRRDLRRHG